MNHMPEIAKMLGVEIGEHTKNRISTKIYRESEESSWIT